MSGWSGDGRWGWGGGGVGGGGVEEIDKQVYGDVNTGLIEGLSDGHN